MIALFSFSDPSRLTLCEGETTSGMRQWSEHTPEERISARWADGETQYYA